MRVLTRQLRNQKQMLKVERGLAYTLIRNVFPQVCVVPSALLGCDSYASMTRPGIVCKELMPTEGDLGGWFKRLGPPPLYNYGFVAGSAV